MIIICDSKDILLREYLLQFFSRSMIKEIKLNGSIKVNNKAVTVRYKLNYHDEIEIELPKEESKIIPEDIPLNIVYEDDYYLIVDKESNMAVMPTRSHPSGTLANALMNYYLNNNINTTVHLVNRLDVETSGLMVVAKHGYYHYLLSKDIKQVNRIYHTIVEGIIDEPGVIDKPIYKIDKQMQRIIDDRGKKSITYYRPLKHINGNTLLEVKLQTGRTHQIRVHFSSLNHPIVGDQLYGSKIDKDLYLRSVEVSFIHPITKELIKVNTIDKY